MRVLFDLNVPRRLRPFLRRHVVRTAHEMGWHEMRNGDLLSAAERSGFEVFITADQNLSYQQKMTERRLAIVLLTRGNWPSVEPHIGEIVQAVETSASASFAVVRCTPATRAGSGEV